MIIEQLVKNLIIQYGTAFCWYHVKKQGKLLINSIDETLVNTLREIAENGKEFQYYCPLCKNTMELFEEEDAKKQFMQIKEQCIYCNSNKIHLKTKNK